MRVLLLASASLIVNIGYWLKYRGLAVLSGPAFTEGDMQKDLVLILLNVLIVADAGSRVMRPRRLNVVSDAEEEVPPAVEDQLDDLLQQREQFQAEIRRARDELTFISRRLQTITEERDGLKSALQKLESWSEGERRPAEPEAAQPAATAMPLSRGMRL